MSTQKPTLRTRFLILSDTHSALPFPDYTDHSFRYPLPTADVLLHAGDLTSNGTLEQHRRAIELIRGVEAELKIVIPGNHDVTLDDEYYAQFPLLHGPRPQYDAQHLEEIKTLYTGEAAKDAGIVYMVEGVETFTLTNGARFTVYASAYQPEFYNWAFGYPREVDRFNPTSSQAQNPPPDFSDENGGGIDIMLTHGPPRGILDKTAPGEAVGCDHLWKAVQRCKPRLHAFGHIHEGWGAVRRKWADADGEAGSDHLWKAVQRWKPRLHALGDEGWGAARRIWAGADAEAPDMNVHSVQVPPPSELVEHMGVVVDATGLEHGSETLFVNASIMDLRYRPINAPWIVDLDLPTTSDRRPDM